MQDDFFHYQPGGTEKSFVNFDRVEGSLEVEGSNGDVFGK